MEGWIITTPNFEYDDNYYYPAGSTTGSVVYLNEARAREALNQANLDILKKILDDGISYYRDVNRDSLCQLIPVNIEE